jgi:hypothetical protein
MRTLIGAVIGTLIALVFACSLARAGWVSNTVHDSTADADESDIGALAISEQDDASFIVTCVGKSKRLAIVFHEPHANWQRGEATEILITSDQDDYRQLPLNGSVIGRTVVAVQGKNAAVADADASTTYADETAAIVLMGKPKSRCRLVSAVTPALFLLQIFTTRWSQCCVSADLLGLGMT